MSTTEPSRIVISSPFITISLTPVTPPAHLLSTGVGQVSALPPASPGREPPAQPNHSPQRQDKGQQNHRRQQGRPAGELQKHGEHEDREDPEPENADEDIEVLPGADLLDARFEESGSTT